MSHAYAPGPRVLLSTLLFLSLLAMVLPTAIVGEEVPEQPTLTVEIDHDEADTWSSVLVIISCTPLVENNTSYYVRRNITVTLTNLDIPEDIVVDENVSLISGIATYTFRVLPDWGEFLLEVSVFDPHYGLLEKGKVKIVYSVEYVIYIMQLGFDEDLKEIDEDNEAAIVEQGNMTLFMGLIVFATLPVALLRLDHKSARQLGKSSMWDKFQDRHFNWQMTPPALWHYLDDPGYEFSGQGKRLHHERRLGYALAALKVDQVVLHEVKEKLEAELDKFEEERKNE